MSVLYKHIIQVWGEGGAPTYHCAPPPPPTSYASDICIHTHTHTHTKQRHLLQALNRRLTFNKFNVFIGNHQLPVFWLRKFNLTWTWTWKRYLRVYIHERFRHACHETRDRQRRSIVSGQEKKKGGGSLSAIEILNTVEKHEWTIKKTPK